MSPVAFLVLLSVPAVLFVQLGWDADVGTDTVKKKTTKTQLDCLLVCF